MHLSKKVFFFSLVFLLAAGSSSAVHADIPADLTIEADSVNYQEDTHQLEASGEVVLSYRDIKVTSDHILYNTATQTMETESVFYLVYGRQNMSGRNLYFDLGKGEGRASGVTLSIGGVNIRGKSLRFSSEEVELSDATFTTCDQNRLYYHLWCQRINVYPQTGWVVSYWGFFYVGPVPLIPIPTYVYVIEEIAGPGVKKNTVPIPQAGYNEKEGWYLEEDVDYFLNDGSHGQFIAEYLSYGELSLGVRHDVVSGIDKGRIGAFYSTKYGVFGGVDYTHFFEAGLLPGYVLKDSQFMDDEDYFRLRAQLSFKEKINYERVSSVPGIYLYSPRLYVLPDVSYTLGFSGVNLKEESSLIQLSEYSSLANLDWKVLLTPGLFAEPSLDWTGRWYTDQSKWTRLKGNVDVLRELPNDFYVGGGYSHYFFNEGGSPFNFENYHVYPQDEIRAKFGWQRSFSGLGVEAYYNTVKQQMNDVDYIYKARLHCLSFKATYRSCRGEILFEISPVSAAD